MKYASLRNQVDQLMEALEPQGSRILIVGGVPDNPPAPDSGIQSPTRGADLAQFSSSWAMKRAVEHALLIIADAAKHIPRAMKDTRPEGPWHKIHGLGNLLRHEYRHISIPKYCGR